MDKTVVCLNADAQDPEQYKSLLNVRVNLQSKKKSFIVPTQKILPDNKIQCRIHNMGSQAYQGELSVYTFWGSFTAMIPQHMTLKIPISDIFWDGEKQQLVDNPREWELKSSHPLLKGNLSYSVIGQKFIYVSLLSYDMIPQQNCFFFWIPKKQENLNWVIQKKIQVEPKGQVYECLFNIVRPIVSRESRIPKIIYQTWKTRDIPCFMENYVESWKKWNPEYHYRFFSDSDCLTFLKEHFPKRVTQAFQMLKVGPYRADLWRYCMLYHTGGVYLDLDSICLCPLSKLIHMDDSFVSARDNPSDLSYIYQAFLAVEKNHPFLREAIDQCVDNIHNKSITKNSLSITGPGLLGKAINKVIQRPLDTKYTIGINSVGPHRFKLYSFNNHNQGIVHQGKSVILTKSQQYFDYQIKSKVDFNLYYIKGPEGLFQEVADSQDNQDNQDSH